MLDIILTVTCIGGILALLYSAITNSKNFLYVMLLVKPFIDVTVNTTLIGNLNGLEISGLLIFLITLIKYLQLKNVTTIFNHSLIWFFIIMQLLSFFIAYSVGQQVLISGVKFFLKVFNAYFIYFIASEDLMSTREKRIKNYRNIWLTTLILSIITIVVYFTGISNVDTTRGLTRYNGLYNDPGTPSYLAVLSILFANLFFEISPKRKGVFYVLYLLTLPIIFYVLYITLTKSALVMLFVYLIMWYGFYKQKFFLVTPILALTIIAGFTFSDGLKTRFSTEIDYVESGGDAEMAKSMGTGRVNRWENLYEAFSESDAPTKFLGTSRPFNAHNQYIAYLMQTGIIGLSLFVIMLYRFTSKLTHIYSRTRSPEIYIALTILTMYMIYGFTGHPFYYTTLLWYLMIMLSLINVYQHEARKKYFIEKQRLNALRNNLQNNSEKTAVLASA